MDNLSVTSSIHSETNEGIVNMYGKGERNSEPPLPKVQPQTTPTCQICLKEKNNKENFIILSCNHVFHIYCLADVHYNDEHKYSVIDEQYLSSRNCPTCNVSLQSEELMFLHSKFLASTKDKVESHSQNITCLESQFNKIKDELRACYEYKQKLDIEREKSKQIVTSLMTML
jgi:hypothetical protein